MATSDSLLSKLWQHLERHGDKIVYAFINADSLDKISYFELDQAAANIATTLKDYGAQPGDRALLVLPQSLTYIKAFYGCLYGHIIAVPVYPPLNGSHVKRISHIANDSGAKFVITNSAIMQLLNESGLRSNDANLKIIDINQIQAATPSVFTKKFPTADTIAFLQYTSGSTGQPKGVIVNHSNLYSNLTMLQEAMAMDERSVIVSWLPLFHDMGLIGNALQAAFLDAVIYLMAPVDFIKRPLSWLEAISAFKATHSNGPNFAYEMCIRTIKPADKRKLDLSSWKVGLNGSEPVRLQTMLRFNQAFQECGLSPMTCVAGYGLAEATLYVTISKPHEGLKYENLDAQQLQQGQAVIAFTKNCKHYLNCGRPVQGERIFIVDPNTLQTVAPRIIGEIWLQGPHISKGYWGSPELSAATCEAYTADKKIGPCLRTGDLGYLNENGDLFVVSRIKDAIIIRGRNYSPQDIEQIVEDCSELIRPNHVAAFSVDIRDEERLVIAIELRDDISVDEAEKLKLRTKKQVAEENGIAVYEVIYLEKNGLPRTTSGKIQRQLAKKKYLTNLSPVTV